MWDKWLAALMKAHQQAPYRAMATDWCWGYHRLENTSKKGLFALLNDRKMNLIGSQRRLGAGIIFTSLTVCALIGPFSVSNACVNKYHTSTKGRGNVIGSFKML